jgi:hypothetical protein
MNQHDESEICLIQNDYADPFNNERVSFYGISAWPTVVGNGLSDAWPISCLEGDYQAHDAIPSPLTIDITEQGVGEFTAHIAAEEDVIDAAFFMVATLDEDVPSNDGMSHLPHHVKVHMTPPATGDPFTLLAGEEVEISHAFVVQPEWNYNLMGVAAWVSRPGGTNPSPCAYGDIGIKNEVLQSRWVPVEASADVENTTRLVGLYDLKVAPDPFTRQTTVTYELRKAASVSLQVYDLAGRLVDELVVGESRPAGRYSVVWDGRDRDGRLVPSGAYFGRLQAGGYAKTMRMVLIR